MLRFRRPSSPGRHSGRVAAATGLIATTALALLAPLAPIQPAQAQQAKSRTVRITGSSTVYPIIQAAIAAFQRTEAGKGSRFDLVESGTSGGLRDLCAGRVPMANASRPISSAELKACDQKGVRFFELPLAFDALTVVVNPRNTWAQAITTQELSRLWQRRAQGRILRWNQVNPQWPARPIRLCGPGSDSGTFDYFNKAINGSATDSRRDYTASEDDNVVVNCVAKDPDALGYLGFGWYAAHAQRLRALKVQAGQGAVAPSPESLLDGSYQPLSRLLFIYVNDRALKELDLLRRFIGFLLVNDTQLVEKARFIPLPGSTNQVVEAKLYRQITGTSFGGELPIGLSVGEAIRRSFAQTKRPAYR
ncbi:PstS family phosphate ABC transporter substrate-binding protein [Cyanobium sp. Morenito 9A2]|nr:PstS family phosphate ABC transporter substrate-binding protein [Cyanobium sp. Morenito 9A2]